MYTNKKIDYRIHSPINIKIIDAKYPVFTPVRNPLDSIASSVDFIYNSNKEKSDQYIQSALNNYINFYYYLKEHKDKTNILFFEKFTKDLNYIENIAKNIIIEDPIKITNEEIILKMNKSDLKLSLPRDNKDRLDYYKEEIVKSYKYKICLESFEYFKNKYYDLY